MTEAYDKIAQGLQEAVEFAEDFSVIDFPKGSRMKIADGKVIVTLPNGRIYSLERLK